VLFPWTFGVPRLRLRLSGTPSVLVLGGIARGSSSSGWASAEAGCR
jgi:hypothetical protein